MQERRRANRSSCSTEMQGFLLSFKATKVVAHRLGSPLPWPLLPHAAVVRVAGQLVARGRSRACHPRARGAGAELVPIPRHPLSLPGSSLPRARWGWGLAGHTGPVKMDPPSPTGPSSSSARLRAGCPYPCPGVALRVPRSQAELTDTTQRSPVAPTCRGPPPPPPHSAPPRTCEAGNLQLPGKAQSWGTGGGGGTDRGGGIGRGLPPFPPLRVHPLAVGQWGNRCLFPGEADSPDAPSLGRWGTSWVLAHASAVGGCAGGCSPREPSTKQHRSYGAATGTVTLGCPPPRCPPEPR